MSRSDAENLKILNGIKPRFEELRKLVIRNDADLERAKQDLNVAKEDAMRIAGTSDEDEIRQIIMDGQRKNSEAVDTFVTQIEEVERNLASLNQSGHQGG